MTGAFVPEPSTWALLIGGVCLLAGSKRMRRSRSARYGNPVPDFDFTVETSELLMELLTVTSVRKLDALTA